jgi:hypothetical protein
VSPSEAAGRNAALVRLASEHFPPITPVDNQLAAVKGAAREIEDLGSALLYVALSQRDLQAHLPEDIRSKTADATGVTVKLGQQEVIVSAGFDLRLSQDDIRVRGEAEAHCAASVEESVLVLRPSASKVQIQRIDYRGDKAPELVIEAINLALDTFLSNLNGAIQSQRVPLELRSVQVVDTAQLLNGLEVVSGAQVSRISVDVALGKSAVLIDPEGIHVLADAVVLSQEQLRELGDLNAAVPSGAAAASAPSLMAEAVSPPSLCGALPDFPDTRVQQLRKLCEERRALRETAASASAVEPVEEGLDVLYPRFREAFIRKVEMIDRRENLFWDRTAIAISRRSLAADLNTVLSPIRGSASLHFPRYEGDLKETMLTPDPPDLKCSENAGACESEFRFRPYNPRGCDSDCTTLNCFGPEWARVCVPGVDLACQGRKIDCERLKEQERLAYEAEKAAALVAWKIQKDACELLKAAKIAGCRINQDWLNLVGNKDVGEIQAHWRADDGELHLTFDGLRFGDDLDSFAVHALLGGGANLGADFTFVPHNAGNLACIAQWSGRVHATARLPLSDVSFLGKLKSAANEANKLVLTFALPGQNFELKVEPPPALALVSQNPQIAAYCPVPAAIVAAIVGQALSSDPVAIFAAVKLGEAALKDTVPFELKGQEISFEIPQRTLQIAGKEVTLIPRWQDSSIVIYAR